MGTPQFVDISQFQPTNIDWKAYKAWSASGDGISRVALRSSYGVGYADTHFAAYRQGALAAGIDRILYYHYSYPALNSAVAEAHWQHNVVGSIRTHDLLMLDFEENVAQATSAWAYAWLLQQESNYGGKLPGLYASSAYITDRLSDSRLAKYPLWLAKWEYTPDERPPVPAPWSSYECVQYTDKAVNIPGIAGTVDANIFLGKEEEPEPMAKTIDLTDGAVASHFEGGPDVWRCKDNGFFLGYGILGFYKKFGGDALCGLTYLGLPRSGEIAVPNHKGVTIQEFERGTVRYDPQHQLDNPPGSGDCHLVHVEQDPRTIAAQTQIADLKKQLAAVQPDAVAKENATLKGKIAAAQKDLS